MSKRALIIVNSLLMGGAQLPEAPYPIMLVGIANFDGAGNYSATVRQSYGGVQQGRTYSGKYEVTPDCKYTEEYVVGQNTHINSSGLITGSGIFQQVDFVYINDARAVQLTLKKMPPGGCSLVFGNYEVLGQGSFCSITSASEPPICTPVAHVGPFTLGADGSLSGSEVVHVGQETAVSDTFTGIATVNADCTFALTLTDSSGLVINEWGVITGEGRSQEMHALVTDPGWVLIENIKKQ